MIFFDLIHISLVFPETVLCLPSAIFRMIDINQMSKRNEQFESFFRNIKSGKLLKGLYRYGADFYLSQIQENIKLYFQHMKNHSESFQNTNFERRGLLSSFINEIFHYFQNFTLKNSALLEELRNVKIQNEKGQKPANESFKDSLNTSTRQGTFNVEKFNQPNFALNDLIGSISQNRILLPDPQNLCCTKIFYENWKLNSNSSTKIMSLSLQEVYVQGILEKYLCAGLNSDRETIILIGIEKQSMKVQGLRLNEVEKQHFTKNVQNRNQVIFPQNSHDRISVSFIPVYANPLQSGKESLTDLTVARITLHKKQKLKPYFINYDRKGFSSIYEVYRVNEGQIQAINGEQIYENVISKKKQRKKRKHYGLPCEVPVKGKLLHEKQNKNLQKMKIIPQQTDTPVFKYKFQSMLVVGSEKKQAQIQKLLSELSALKYKYFAMKPFQRFRRKTGRKIWFISHDQKFQNIEKIKKKTDKGSTISFFSVQKNLKIDDFQSKAGKMKEFMEMFEAEFDKKVKIYSNRNQEDVDLKEYFFIFDNLEEAIYAYVCLDMVARAVFVKDFQVLGQPIRHPIQV